MFGSMYLTHLHLIQLLTRLQQWLKGAATCPVCRKSVIGSPSPSFNTPAGPSSSSDSNLRTAPEAPLRWHFHHLRRLPLRPPAETGPSRSRSNNANTNQAPESSNSASITTGLRLGQRYSSGVATSSSQTSRPSRARRNTNTNNNNNHSNTNASREAETGADSGSSESGTGSDSADDYPFTRNSRPAWGRYMP